MRLAFYSFCPQLATALFRVHNQHKASFSRGHTAHVGTCVAHWQTRVSSVRVAVGGQSISMLDHTGLSTVLKLEKKKTGLVEEAFHYVTKTSHVSVTTLI